MEKRLKVEEMNGFLLAALASIGDGVIATDIDGSILYMNASAVTLTGWSATEAIGRSVDKVFSIINASTGEALESIIKRVYKATGSIGLEKNSLLVTKCGGRRYVSANVSPIGEENVEIKGIVIVFRDITSHIEKEQRLVETYEAYAKIFENFPMLLGITDQEKRCNYLNKSWLDFTGMKKEEALGFGWLEAYHPEDRDEVKRIHCQSFDQRVSFQIESRLKRYDGVYRWVMVVGTPYYDIDKEFAGYIGVVYDINERKDFEITLSKMSDFYLKILENFPAVIWRSGLDKKLNYIDKGWTEYTGVEPEKAFGRGWLDYVHPEDKEKTIGKYQEHFEKQLPYEIEFRILTYEGKYRWVHNIARPFYDFKDRFDGYIGMVLDITDRKEAEEGMKRYQVLAERTRDIILFMDIEDGQIIEANEAAVKAYGYTYKELTSRTIFHLRGSMVKTKMQMKAAKDQGIFFEAIHYRKDGTFFPVEVSSQRATIGEKQVLVSIIRDICERKKTEKALRESEEKYRGLFHAAIDCIYLQKIIKDSDKISKIVEVNEAMCRRLGYTKEELLNLHITDIAKKDSKETRDDIMHQIITKGQYTFETIHFKKNGEEIPVEVNAHYISMEGKKYILCFGRDITERKNTENQLRKAKEAAELANKSKSDFLANMSHEVRTPINGIIGMIDLTLLTKLDPEQQENLMIAKTCANSLLRLINDILDFSKMEAGKLSFQNIGFNIKGLMEETIKLHTTSAGKKGLKLNYSLSNHIPQVLEGDPNRLQQILNNLLNNAIKFTTKGEVTLSIDVVSTEGEDIVLKFRVSDTGIGIAEGDQLKLFKSFSQIDGSVTRNHGGTGLGLAISKQLVEIMGGDIWVESEKSKGSSFHFTAKFKMGGENTDQSSQQIPINKAMDSKKILLAEDDYVNQIVMTKMLKEKGYKIDVANNGKEALALYEQKEYDLILMDIQMPELDGIEATRLIRERETSEHRTTPIIAITAYALNGDREKFLALGMDEYIAKPVDMKEMFDRIEKVIASKEKKLLFNSNNDVRINGAGEIEFYGATIENTKEEISGVLEKIQKGITELEEVILLKDLDIIEEIANKIKILANSIEADDLKTGAFRIELATRRGNLQEAVNYALQLKHEFATYKKSVILE